MNNPASCKERNSESKLKVTPIPIIHTTHVTRTAVDHAVTWCLGAWLRLDVNISTKGDYDPQWTSRSASERVSLTYSSCYKLSDGFITVHTTVRKRYLASTSTVFE